MSGAVTNSVNPAAMELAIEYFLSCLSFIGSGAIVTGLITPAITHEATVEKTAGFLLTADKHFWAVLLLLMNPAILLTFTIVLFSVFSFVYSEHLIM